jgi:uncharacterized RDD family membrane protein YckC
MNKITTIKVEKELYKFETDAEGNRIKVPYIGKVTYELQLVTGFKRIAHFIVDIIAIYTIVFVVFFAIGFTNPSYSAQFSFLLERLLPYVIYVGYYLICESTMQRTLGKFLTRSLVVDEYGNKPDFGTILGRSLARIVPFEALSCLGKRGWHDIWSETYLISETELEEVKKLSSDGFYISSRTDVLD